MSEQLQDKFLKVMSLLFKREIKADDGLSMAANRKEWSSIKHIEIIMTMEEEFDISFEPEDIPLLTSQNVLWEKVQELVNA